MAINKTIDPTNVAVQIPAMADKPNQAANSNCLDKIIDGVNALNSNLISRTRPSDNPIGYSLKSGFSLESWGQINIRQAGGLLVVNVGGLTSNHEISADEEFLTLTDYTINNMGSAYSMAWLTNRDKPGNVSAFSGKIYLNRIPANAVIFFQIAIPVYI